MTDAGKSIKIWNVSWERIDSYDPLSAQFTDNWEVAETITTDNWDSSTLSIPRFWMPWNNTATRDRREALDYTMTVLLHYVCISYVSSPPENKPGWLGRRMQEIPFPRTWTFQGRMHVPPEILLKVRISNPLLLNPVSAQGPPLHSKTKS